MIKIFVNLYEVKMMTQHTPDDYVFNESTQQMIMCLIRVRDYAFSNFTIMCLCTCMGLKCIDRKNSRNVGPMVENCV